ncbi:MAG: hypothetical protein AB8H79_13885 [Myxococcota bacterium]
MPASPHLERFTLNDEGQHVDVVAIAHHTIDGTELVLLIPEDAFDEPGDDMDAWVQAVTAKDGTRALTEPPEAAVDPAWAVFEEVLTLTFSNDTPSS